MAQYDVIIRHARLRGRPIGLVDLAIAGGRVAALLKQAQIGALSDPHTGPLYARVVEQVRGGVERNA